MHVSSCVVDQPALCNLPCSSPDLSSFSGANVACCAQSVNHDSAPLLFSLLPQLPPALVRAFNRRLFTRLSCLMVGSSMLGPTVQQQPLAGSGSTVPQQGGPHLHSVTGSTVGAGRRDATASPGLSDVVALRCVLKEAWNVFK
jgi:hypothetical protein